MSRSVVVTRADSGIGPVTARELAGAGHDVFGTARGPEKEAVTSGLRALPVRTPFLS